MTRRKIIFIDSDYSKYATPEFNGDKSELISINSADSCDMDWTEIEEIFQKCETLEQFQMANEYVQKAYHSCCGETEVAPIERCNADDYYTNDEHFLLVYAPDVDVARNHEFRVMLSQYCRQEIAKGHCGEDMCEYCEVNHVYSRIFDPVDLAEEDECDEEVE